MNPYAAEQPPLDCREFVERHSEYLDGQLTQGEWVEFDDHIASCAVCERYDRVVRRGLLLIRNTVEVEPSPDFHDRLDARLRTVEMEIRGPIMPDNRTALMIAAVLAMIGLTPLVPLMMRDSATEIDAVLPAAPVAEAFDPVPWNFPSDDALLLTPGPNAATLTAAGPFTPLVVQAPVMAERTTAPQMTPWPVLMIGDR